MKDVHKLVVRSSSKRMPINEKKILTLYIRFLRCFLPRLEPEVMSHNTKALDFYFNTILVLEFSLVDTTTH